MGGGDLREASACRMTCWRSHGMRRAPIFSPWRASGATRRCRAGRRAMIAPWLAVGHHVDDQAETLLMRLARGSGVGGAAGVRPARRSCSPTTSRETPIQLDSPAARLATGGSSRRWSRRLASPRSTIRPIATGAMIAAGCARRWPAPPGSLPSGLPQPPPISPRPRRRWTGSGAGSGRSAPRPAMMAASGSTLPISRGSCNGGFYARAVGLVAKARRVFPNLS